MFKNIRQLKINLQILQLDSNFVFEAMHVFTLDNIAEALI